MWKLFALFLVLVASIVKAGQDTEPRPVVLYRDEIQPGNELVTLIVKYDDGRAAMQHCRALETHWAREGVHTYCSHIVFPGNVTRQMRQR